MLVLIILPLQISRAQSPPPGTSQQPAEIRTSADSALAKLHPKLRPKARAAGDAILLVRIDAKADAELDPYVAEAVTRPFAPLGEATTLARVPASNLIKLAALDAVIRVQPIIFDITHRPAPPDPDVHHRPTLAERRERMKALEAIDIPWNESITSGGDAVSPTGWFDVHRNHRSKTAWQKGYRGQGVKVAVLDSGADLGHPDLRETWAVVEDETSPYYGWPIAYDPWSMLVYVLDQNFGTTFAKTGFGFYVDTSTTPHVYRSFEDRQQGIARLKFAPFVHSDRIGSKQPRDIPHEYIIPDTSTSGVYHIGNHPDRSLSEVFSEHVAVLVVDEHEKGVYDTVYVDLDNDHDFTDEKPVTWESPAAYRDMDGDGITDISGGIVYFIADGTTPIPATDWLYGQLAPPPSNGNLVAFMGDFDPEIFGHGTSTSSNVVGQAQIGAKLPEFRDLPGDGRPQGAVPGAAPEAQLVSAGDIYVNFDTSVQDAYLLTLLGYDGIPETGDDVQIISNSYGESDVDNDGWDYKSRYIDRWVRLLNPTVSMLFSVGNGGPGYGTVAPPSPEVGIGLGASTEFGSTGWDSITDTDQINFGDVIPFSAKGPDALGRNGVDAVADGAFAPGDIPVNQVFDGTLAWRSWGGTSRSSPVAAGNLALVYQAFRERHDRWPTYAEARAVLMSGARQTGLDPLSQGAGVVDANSATAIAAGSHGIYVMPQKWPTGGYRGSEYPAFANITLPNVADRQVFTFTNPSNHDIQVSLSGKVLRRTESRDISFTTQPEDQESQYNFNAPDYLIRMEDIPQDADLMRVRVIFPMEQLDADGDLKADQGWRVLLYNWKDINGDGNLWEDADEDGIVDHMTQDAAEPHFIDGFPPLDWTQTEIDRWEYSRFSYGYNTANNLQVSVGHPAERMHGGIFIGLQHREHSKDIPQTDLTIQIDFYTYKDWEWLSFDTNSIVVPAQGKQAIRATLTVPDDAAYGEYQGVVLAEYAGRAPFRVILPLIWHNASPNGGASAALDQTNDDGAPPSSLEIPPERVVIPVMISVAAEWDRTGTVGLGGPAAADPDALYDNAVVRGGFDWLGRPDAGDWRFFYVDIQGTPDAGTKLITRGRWDDAGPPTDIDTLIYGPASDRFSDPGHPDNSRSNWAEPEYYGPYTLRQVGGSENWNVTNGVWAFQTATNGPEEWVAGDAQSGLHLLMQHNVLFSGEKFDVPHNITLGAMNVQPTALNFTTTITTTETVSACTNLTFTTSLELPALAAEGYGLSRPEVKTEQEIEQDDPNDPQTASYKRDFTLEHASSLEIRTQDATGLDLDVYLLYDQNGDSAFAYPDELVTSATTPEGNEQIVLRHPPDGDYQVWVHGWSVPIGQGTFTFVLDAIQGYEVSVEGVPGETVAADEPAVMNVCYETEIGPGEALKGEVLIGPSVAPGVIIVPVKVSATGG